MSFSNPSNWPTALSTERLTREHVIETSVGILAQTALAARGYAQNTGDTTGFTLLESFPYGLERLDTNLIAAGFNFDDGGVPFELGSNMKERKYTIEFYVFGVSLMWAKALANALKFSLEVDQVIPLWDITQTPPVESGEWVEVDSVHSARSIAPDAGAGGAEPWQDYMYCVTVQVTDYYVPANT